MPIERPTGQIDVQDLIDFVESRPELRHIRDEVDRALVDYRPGDETPERRLRICKDRILRTHQKGLAKQFRDLIWVPARNMRGRSYTTPSLDGSINATSKMMSISTLWDFFCTLPIFVVGLSVPLGALTWPGAATLSLLILIASNCAGEKATDRRDKLNAKTATLSLTAFILLSLAKTAFSGVGIDLWIGSRNIASNYAASLAAQKITADQEELQRLQAKEGPQLIQASDECDELKATLNGLDRSKNEKMFQSLYVLAYGSKAAEQANRGLTPAQIINKYGSIAQVPGACNQERTLRALKAEEISEYKKKVEAKTKALKALPPLNFLKTHEPEIYQEHFNDRAGTVQFSSGTTAVAQATDQYIKQIARGEFGKLGFSMLFLSISLILSAAASIMIYQLSQNPGIKASYSDYVNYEKTRRLQAYRQAMKDKFG